MKKLFILTMLFACSMAVQAQTFFKIDGVRYMIEDDHAVVARQDIELTGDINIPATVTYGDTEYNVTRLMGPDDGASGGGGAFQDCEITSITLPEAITEVPNSTFSRCKQLCSAILNGPVTRIGAWAFDACEALTTIEPLDNVTEMGEAAFQGTGLTWFKIPEGVEELFPSVFAGTKIIYLEIPASVKNIAGAALNMNKTDEQGQPLSITVKMFQRDCRLIEISYGAFGDDITAIDLQVPAGGKVVYQEYLPWMNMNSITEYGEDTGEPLIPDQRHVTIDGIRYVLKDGEAHVDIQPETLSGDITIPEKVTYDDIDYPVTTVLEAYSFDLSAFSETSVTKVTLPSSFKKIGVGAFSKSNCLQEVVLNEGLTEIGESAFSECPKLTTINIPSTVSVIHKSLFRECHNLKTLTLSDGITSLEFEALYNSGIETLTIPSTCTLFGSCSLYLPNLKTLIMKVKEPSDIINVGEYHTETMNVSVFSDYFLPDYEVVREFLSNVDLIVPLGCADSYKVQDPWYNFRSITEEGSDYYQPKNIGVNIDGINYVLKETINEQNEPVRTATIAQQNPNLLSGDIVIPEKVSYAKKVLQGDEWVTLEAQDYDVTDIFTSIIDFNGDDRGYSSGAGAFQECPITSISLPATITTIPTKAFYGCQQLKSIILPEGITTIRAGAFANCSSLEEIYLPETITYMGGDYIFRNCTSLKKVNIPKQITSLSSEFFLNSGIETFIIPKNITSIGWACFAGTPLKSIKICHESYSDNSFSFPENIFDDISGITLIVPEGTKESLYSQVYPWKNFDNIIEYSDQHDEHQYNNYRVEFEDEADEEEEPDEEEETPAAGRSRLKKTKAVDEPVTAGFTPSGVAPELPTEIEKNGKKYAVTYKETLAVMPASDVVLKVALTRIGAGDVNGDGTVDANDITEIVKYILHPWDGFNIGAADANDDGVVNIADIIYILNGN
jgi:hypothetical protein